MSGHLKVQRSSPINAAVPLGITSVRLQWRCFEVRLRLGDFNRRKITFQAHGLVQCTSYSCAKIRTKKRNMCFELQVSGIKTSRYRINFKKKR